MGKVHSKVLAKHRNFNMLIWTWKVVLRWKIYKSINHLHIRDNDAYTKVKQYLFVYKSYLFTVYITLVTKQDPWQGVWKTRLFSLKDKANRFFAPNMSFLFTKKIPQLIFHQFSPETIVKDPTYNTILCITTEVVQFPNLGYTIDHIRDLKDRKIEKDISPRNTYIGSPFILTRRTTEDVTCATRDGCVTGMFVTRYPHYARAGYRWHWHAKDVVQDF